MPDRKINFCSKFAIKTLPCYSCKYCHRKSKVSPYIIWYVCALHADDIWSIWYGHKCTKCVDCWQKTEFLKKHFWQILTLFCKRFLLLKQLFNGKPLFFRLLSFSVSKIMVVRHVQTKHSVNSLKGASTLP